MYAKQCFYAWVMPLRVGHGPLRVGRGVPWVPYASAACAVHMLWVCQTCAIACAKDLASARALKTHAADSSQPCGTHATDLRWICDVSAMDLQWICDGSAMDLRWVRE